MKEIFDRVSVRNFLDKEVEDEKIEKLLRSAMQAPSSGNGQPWVFYVIKNKEILEKLSTTSPYASCSKNAPMAIVIGYRKDAKFKELSEIDCAIATENMWLEATYLDLGMVMLAVAPFKERIYKVKEILSLNDNIIPFTILPIGYKTKDYKSVDRFDKDKIFYID